MVVCRIRGLPELFHIVLSTTVIGDDMHACVSSSYRAVCWFRFLCICSISGHLIVLKLVLCAFCGIVDFCQHTGIHVSDRNKV